MDVMERSALDAYVIEPFDTFYPSKDNAGDTPLGIGIKGIDKPIRFKNFYESMHTYCSHTDGAVIVQLVNQLTDGYSDDWEYTDFINKAITEDQMSQIKCCMYCCCCPCLSIMLFMQYVLIPTVSLIFMGVMEWYSALEDAKGGGYKGKLIWITLVVLCASVGAGLIWNYNFLQVNDISLVVYIGICIAALSSIMTATSGLYELFSDQYQPSTIKAENSPTAIDRIKRLNEEKSKLGFFGYTTIFTEKHKKKREIKSRIRSINYAIQTGDRSTLDELDKPYVPEAKFGM